MSLTYQWQRRIGSGSWSDISGATSRTYTIQTNSTSDNYSYRCVVGSTLHNLETNSNQAELTMKANNPTISKHPSSKSVTSGTNVNFSCTASAPYGSVSYQWYYRTSSSGSWQVSGASGNKTNTILVTASSGANGRQYRCKITATAGGAVRYTNAATMTVTQPAGRPIITTHPSNQSGPSGSNARFSVRANSNGSAITSWRWQYKNVGGSWAYSSNTGQNINVTINSGSNGRQYRAVVTNGVGSTTSNAATITMT